PPGSRYHPGRGPGPVLELRAPDARLGEPRALVDRDDGLLLCAAPRALPAFAGGHDQRLRAARAHHAAWVPDGARGPGPGARGGGVAFAGRRTPPPGAGHHARFARRLLHARAPEPAPSSLVCDPALVAPGAALALARPPARPARGEHPARGARTALSL